MLAVADRSRTAACEVRLSYADLMLALNASRSVVRDAVRVAVDSGELLIVVPGKGTRPALYRLPGAVGYVRGSAPSGPDSEPLGPNQDRSSVPDSEPQASSSGSDSEPLAKVHDHASGSESGTEWAGIRPSSGSESGPHYQSQGTKKEGASEEPAPSADPIPELARPLVDSCTLLGVHVRWNLNAEEWTEAAHLVARSGVAVLAEHARKVYAARSITYARYFLPGWREQPPLPRPGAERPPLKVVTGNGHQTHRAHPDAVYQQQGSI
jgi:hypothetical protein